MPVESGHMPRIAFILVVLIAVLSHFWVLGLPFKLDDVAQIPRAGDKLRDEIGAVVPAARNDSATIYEHDRFRFRPLLWTLFAAELAVSGSPAGPTVFHATSLLIHAICAALLLAVLGRVLPRAAAVAGAAVFALNAPGTQAVAWIAARPDLMTTAFGLAALAVVQRGVGGLSHRRCAAIGALLAGALLSKVSGVAVVAVVVGVGFACYERRVGRWALVLLPAALAWWWRSAYLETWLPSYTSGRSVADADVVGSVLGLPALLAEAIAPWWSPGDGNVREPVSLTAMDWLGGYARGAFAVVVLAAGAIAASRVGRKARIGVVVACSAAVVLALPLAFLFRPDGLATMSRSFYPVSAALAALLGVVVAGPLGRGLARPAAMLVAATVVFVHGDALGTAASSELAASERIDAQLAAITRPPVGLSVVIGQELYDHGVVMLGNMTHLRLRPPFAETRHQVRVFDSATELVSSGLLSDHRGALSVFALTDDARHIRRVVDYPRLGAAFPELVSTAEGWAPSHPVATRDVGAVRVVRRSPGAPRGLRLLVDTSAGTLARSLSADASVYLIGEDIPWLLAGALEGIRVEPADEVAGIILLAEAPGIESLLPADGLVWGGGPITFSVRSPAAARLRIHIRGSLQGLPDPSIQYEFPLRQMDGITTWELDEGAWVASSLAGLSMASVPRLFEEQAAPVGMTSLRLEWRAEALGASGVVVALSPWRRFVYKP